MNPDARNVGVFVGLLTVLVVAALVWPWPASAHNASVFRSPHEWLDGIFGGKTEAPAVHPLTTCRPEIEGQERLIHDPILDVWVLWVCRCPDDGAGCRWFRVAWFPEKPIIPGFVTVQRYGVDTHRTCASIVCKRHRHLHYWQTMVHASVAG